MSRTPAAELARLRVTYGLWRIDRVNGPDWTGLVAQRRDLSGQVTAETAGALEARILEAERNGGTS